MEASQSATADFTFDPALTATTMRSGGEDAYESNVVSPPFTDDVSDGLTNIRRCIQETQDGQPEVARALHGLMDDITGAFERQTLLMFKNWEIDQLKHAEYLRIRNEEDIMAIRKDAGCPAHMHGVTTKHLTHEQAKSLRPTSPNHGAKDPPALQLKTKKNALLRDVKAKATASTCLHACLTSLVYQTAASMAVLYLYDKTTSTLRAICSAPNVVEITIPSHVGIPGHVFNSCVAFCLDTIGDDAAPLVKPADQMCGRTTNSLLAFPVVSGTQKLAMGVIELINKKNGVKWTGHDEQVAYHTAVNIYHILKQVTPDVQQQLENRNIQALGIDILAAQDEHLREQQDPNGTASDSNPESPDKQATATNTSASPEPQDPPSTSRGDDSGPIGQTSKTQLVFRPEHGSMVKLDPATTGNKAQPITDCTNVREIHNYLSTLEESYRRGLNQLVLVDAEKREAQAESNKRANRIRVLEENISYLTDQIKQLMQANAAHKYSSDIPQLPPPAGHFANFSDFAATEPPRLESAEETAETKGTPPPAGGLEVEHTEQVKETLALANRLATMGLGVPAAQLTTSIPANNNDPVLIKRPQVSKKEQALATLKQRRLPAGPESHPIHAHNYKLTHVPSKSMRMVKTLGPLAPLKRP